MTSTSHVVTLSLLFSMLLQVSRASCLLSCSLEDCYCIDEEITTITSAEVDHLDAILIKRLYLQDNSLTTIPNDFSELGRLEIL